MAAREMAGVGILEIEYSSAIGNLYMPARQFIGRPCGRAYGAYPSSLPLCARYARHRRFGERNY